MPLTEKNRSFQRNPYGSATLPTINLTWNSPESNPDLRHKSLVTNSLSHGTVNMYTNIKVVAFWRKTAFSSRPKKQVTPPHSLKVLHRKHLAIYGIGAEEMTFRRWRNEFKKYDTPTFTITVQDIKQNQSGGRKFWGSTGVLISP